MATSKPVTLHSSWVTPVEQKEDARGRISVVNEAELLAMFLKDLEADNANNAGIIMVEHELVIPLQRIETQFGTDSDSESGDDLFSSIQEVVVSAVTDVTRSGDIIEVPMEEKALATLELNKLTLGTGTDTSSTCPGTLCDDDSVDKEFQLPSGPLQIFSSVTMMENLSRLNPGEIISDGNLSIFCFYIRYSLNI